MVRWQNLSYSIVPNTLGFTIENYAPGPLQHIHGKSFAASSGECFLGPDIAMYGGTTNNNQPTATGEGWDTPWIGINRPGHVFTQDQYGWRRGHLINGEWGGSGSDWRNLIPLTPQANSWHTGVENSMRAFLAACYSYDTTGAYKNDWYGIHYRVVRSVDPLADPTNRNNLYSYAPSHINVCWRAVRFPKAAGGSLQAVVANAVANHAQVAALPHGFPNFTAYNAPGALLGHQVGSPLVAAAEPWAANANNFDGSIEIHNAV